MVFRSGELLVVYALSLCVLWPVTTLAARQKSTSAETPDMASVNGADWQEKARPTLALLIKLQVLLDRAHVSPGEIDGNFGENTRKAIAAVRQLNSLEPSDQLDRHVWHMLTEEDSEPALITYKISEKDTAGPFVKRIPADFRKKAAMDRLDYTSAEELLAEKFHMSPQLLRKLNRGVRFDKTGQEILVANVERSALAGKISRVEVDAERQRVLAYDKDHNVVAIYPATVGSKDRPSPEGEFKVTKISENPVYHYDPALHLRGVDVKKKLDLPPGPNNPVGVVWISLSAEGYGIHGTPDPDKISKAASNGCIRLTNWDAVELAHHVSKGIPVLIARSAIISQAKETGGRPGPVHSVAAPQAELPPLPEQNPARAHRQAHQTPPPPGEVPTLPWSEAEIAAAKTKCTEALSTLKLDYQPLPPIKAGLCGTPAPILLKSLGSEPKVAITPPATLDCAMAGALNRWLDKTVQPQAKELLGSPVIKLENISSYVCRNRYDSPNQPLSEHALANALDVSGFVLASGEHITVLDSWPKASPPLPLPNPVRVTSIGGWAETISLLTSPKSEFVKKIHDDACGTFETVLGPEANEAHKNHFHLDMKERRSAFCQ